MCNRASPESYLLYKHALSLFKLSNEQNDNTFEWIALNFNQILTSRQGSFKTMKTNKRRVGLNALANRLSILNDRIPLDWLNLGYDSYKLKCKNEFLKWNCTLITCIIEWSSWQHGNVSRYQGLYPNWDTTLHKGGICYRGDLTFNCIVLYIIMKCL